MQWSDGRYRFSPSDLTELLGCRHSAAQSRAAARGERDKAYAASAYANLVFAKGNEHEDDYRRRLIDEGRDVEDLRDWPRDTAAARTIELMRAGADVIFQGALEDDDWRGIADFLERVDEPSDLGDWSYEAVDTKLARVEAKPSHALQLCFYSEAVARIQGRAPRFAHIELGSGLRETLRVRELLPYFRRARLALEQDAAADAPTEPYPVPACVFCSYRRECEEAWRTTDHLTLVAGIRRTEFEHLRAAAVSSRRALGALPTSTPVEGLRESAVDALRQQARLQVEAESLPVPPYELLPVEAGRGFTRLPEASAGDVFFDIEGHPYFTAASDLTFLFGLILADGGNWRYEPIWAHDLEQEGAALERVVDRIGERLAAHPDMHVYHYSPAEPGVLQRLMARHATREAEVDVLLRQGVLVDLYYVLRQGMRVGVESYGLKHVEQLAGFERSAAVGTGSDAVLAYDTWMHGGDQAELDGIARYNEEDCRSTLALRDWLVGVRPADVPPAPIAEVRERSEKSVAREQRAAALRSLLIEGEQPGSARWLAGELLEYHRREARPGWWRWYALQQMDGEELCRDAEAIGLLEPVGLPQPLPRANWERTLRFPPQNHKLAGGDGVDDPETGKGVNLVHVDDDACTVTVRARRFKDPDDYPRGLIPGGPFNTEHQQEALLRLAESIRDATGTFPALEEILARNLPRFADGPRGAKVQTTDLAEQQRLARSLDRSYLLVQGPPGTGKTYTGARLIVDLIAAGHRVGVTALSHRAINNLLEAVEEAADEVGVTFEGARRDSGHEDSRVPDGWRTVNVADAAECLDERHRLVGGTTWLFAPQSFDNALDYLVIDEAGQLSLADALAAGTAARNLILLGDPLQLPQVSQALHPPGTNASVLEHLLHLDATVPEDRGLFLTETWRMHPDVCQFISEQVYEDRLSSEVGTERQWTGAGTGIRFLPVEHAGNASQSREEADAIRSRIDDLLGQPYTDRDGVTRPLVATDIMVVSPYNAQVRLLKSVLPDGVPIGTVDAFQGQEAPVVIFSMATSTGEDAPRDIGFLFSRNRLNVAISRARCLAILCCSPALLETKARTIEDMRLISTLCALVEAAEAATV